MKVLVLGSGGREHAIAWKIKQSERCSALFCLPGNPGTARIAENLSGSVKDFDAVKGQVLRHGIDLVVAGPEDPLVEGLRDFFESDPQLRQVLFVGPGRSGARLEGSKDFAKDFMIRHGIPTAAYRSFTADRLPEADRFLDGLQAPFVLKADGLAAGKGVLIVEDREEAKRQLREMMNGKFGAAGRTVVIEEFLRGIEVSVFVLTDGRDYLILPEAKDYKRIGEGDTGLNTGGMGAVSPVPFADGAFMEKVESRIIRPTIEGLRKDGIDYRGFIFLGLMNCGGDPYVIEYNVRMGDPETEAVMTRIDSDLLAHLAAAARGELAGEKISVSPQSALTVVCVSGGYPESYGKGFEITGSPYLAADGCGAEGAVTVFHSGTALHQGKLVTAGGRVLAVTVNGKDLSTCREAAVKEVEKIRFAGKYYRRDIGMDVLAPEER